MRKRFVFVAALAAAGVGFAETFTWTGAEDAYWTNAANWTVGGAVATRCPGVVSNDDMTVTWAAWSSNADRAIFSGPTAHANIDLDGLFSVSNVTVSGADTPPLTFDGASHAAMPLKVKGSFCVEADVTGGISLPRVSVGIGCNSSKQRSDFVDYVNNSKALVSIGDVGWGVLHPDRTGTYWSQNLRLSGTGDFAVTGSRGGEGLGYSGLFDPVLQTSGKVTVSGNAYTDMRYPQLCGVSEVEIASGAKFSVQDWSGANMEITKSVDITGEGAFGLSTQNPLTVGAGAVVRLLCPLNVTYRNTHDYFAFSGSGEVHLLGAAGSITKSSKYTRISGVRVLSPVIGKSGEAGYMLGDRAVMAMLLSKGTIAYTGAGEVTDRRVDLGDVSGGAVEQVGTGTWTVDAEVVIDPSVQSSTLELRNNVAAEGVWRSAIVGNTADGEARTLSLRKTGTGVWRLAAANAYTGETVLEGGTLVADVVGAIPSSSKLVFNGGRLELVGGADERLAYAFDALSVSNGTSVLRVTGKATVTVGSGARESGATGKLSVVADDEASVVIADAAGTAPAWLLFRGLPAKVDADGKVVPVCDAAIAARGDRVPNSPGLVGIAYDGTGGDDTLAESAVSVGSLVQAAGTPAVVAMDADETLTADSVSITSEGASLTVGSVAGQGVLAATGALRLRNDSAAALTVKAAVGPTDDVRVEGGANAVTLAGGGTKPLTIKQTGSTLVLTGERTFDIDQLWIGTNSAAGVTTATLVLDGAKDVLLSNKACRVGFDYRLGRYDSHEGTAVMVVTNSLLRNHEIYRTAYPDAAPTPDYTNQTAYGIQVGDRCYGELHIRAGAVITNRLMLGNVFEYSSDNGYGTVYQDGGEMSVLGRSSGVYNGSFIGNRASHGYYQLDGGRLNWFGDGGVGGYCSGILIQNGGAFYATGCLGSMSLKEPTSFLAGFANSGHGQIVFRGGTAKFDDCTRLKACGAANNNPGEGEILVDGDASVDCGTNTVVLGSTAATTSTHQHRIALAGGTLAARGFYHVSEPSARSRAWVSCNV